MFVVNESPNYHIQDEKSFFLINILFSFLFLSQGSFTIHATLLVDSLNERGCIALRGSSTDVEQLFEDLDLQTCHVFIIFPLSSHITYLSVQPVCSSPQSSFVDVLTFRSFCIMGCMSYSCTTRAMQKNILAETCQPEAEAASAPRTADTFRKFRQFIFVLLYFWVGIFILST